MRILVVGGSAAGLFAGLVLARSGHEVLLLDRDPLVPAADVDAAAEAAFRPAAPQLAHPHVVLPRCRELLRERLPDVYAALLAAGAAEAPLATQMPPTLSDRSTWPGDERLTPLMTRRSTFDWVLRRAAAAQPGLTVRDGVAVTGLLARPGTPPRVIGVHTDDGDHQADLVVDATGRRSAIDRWLAMIDAPATATDWAECTMAYYSRHYRLRTSAGLPGPPTTRVVAALDEFTIGIWGADNGTMVLAIVPLVEDKRFRRVAQADVFTAVARAVPLLVPWLDVLEPISPVFPMGGLQNTFRRLVVDGMPVVTGLAAVGDSVCTTNPTLARGIALALRSALDLTDALDHAEDPIGLARALDRAAGEHVQPFFTDQAAIDAARLAELRHTLLGAPAPAPPDRPERVSFAQLRSAAAFDPLVFRAFWQVFGMLRLPEEVYVDPAVVARTHLVLRERGGGPPIAQPSRAQLARALEAAPSTVPPSPGCGPATRTSPWTGSDR